MKIIAVLIGIARPIFIFHEFNKHIQMSYQALAHIFIGVLLALWIFQKNREAKYTFLALTIIEVVCAAITIAVTRRTL